MKKLNNTACALTLMLCTGMSNASPLDLSYSVTDLGSGIYDYDFTLTLDNNDSSWASGQGWTWLTFGAEKSVSAGGTGVSPLTGFVGDLASFVGGPWNAFTTSSGGVNGPTLSHPTSYWTPTAIGEMVMWSGTSSALLGQGQLLFNTLLVNGPSTVKADFQVANLIATPIPAAAFMFAPALLGFMGLRRKAKNSVA